MTDLARQYGLEPRRVAGKWGWFVGLGALMVVAGAFALGDTILVTLLSVIFLGAALLVCGVVQIVHAFANKGWGSFLFALFCGGLYVVGGLLIMDEPGEGSFVVTVCVMIVLAANGVLRIVMALRHRELPGWWLMLLGGLISIGVAVLLFLSLPWSSLWLLGTLIAVELIFNGVGWITLGFALRAAQSA